MTDRIVSSPGSLSPVSAARGAGRGPETCSSVVPTRTTSPGVTVLLRIRRSFRKVPFADSRSDTRSSDPRASKVQCRLETA